MSPWGWVRWLTRCRCDLHRRLGEPETLKTALRVVECESRFDPAAVSWDGSSYGLFQLWKGHTGRWPTFWSEWSDPVQNTAWAYEFWREQGWAPWDCW